MPFSDIYARLLAAGANPFVPGGMATPPGATPPFLPPTQRPVGGIGSVGPGPGAPMGGGGLLQRIAGRLFPVSDASGLTTPEQQQAAQRQGLLGFGASLLANSGPQPGPGIGFGAALGQALQAGQQTASGGINDQLQQLLLKAKIEESKQQVAGQDPAKVREYLFAKQNGYTGSYQDFLQLGQGGVGNFNPGDYTPESLKEYLASRTPANPLGDPGLLKRYAAPVTTVRTVDGVPTVVNAPRGGGAITQTPLTTLGSTTDAARSIKTAEAEGSAIGAATGGALGGIQKKSLESASALRLIDQAEDLIDASTGSAVGAGVDKLVGLFGFAPTGAQAAASLKVLGANLVTSLPRLEGPQSDRDMQLYKEAAAQIGDETVPNEIRKTALKTVRRIQEQYRDQFQGQAGPAAGGTPATRKPLSDIFGGKK